MSTKIMRQNIISTSKSSLAQFAYDTLKESIIINMIHPGDILSEQGIAKQLNISRTPVHEALMLLEKDGLVQIQRGVGALVTPLSFQDIRYVQEARMLVEPVAVRYALDNITNEDLCEMRELILQLQNRLLSGEDILPQEGFKMDFDFHSMIISRCSNPYIRQFLYMIRSNIRRLQVLSYDHQCSLESFISQHLSLLDVISTRDADAAEEAYREHLYISFENIGH